MSYKIRISILVIFSLIISSCATRKKKGEVGWLGKVYHNTTAKYNGYYNAGVLVDESILTLEAQHEENYNQLLPLYPIIAVDNPKIVAEDLDRAIEKVTTVALLHEPSHWVDDCYVMMGRAQFLKQDFESAEETLEYFASEFNPTDPNSRVYKKADTKKSNADKRREESDASKKLREQERKRLAKQKEDRRELNAQTKEIERKKRVELREFRKERTDLSKKQKEEDRDLSDKRRKLRSEHQKETSELKKKHRDAARKRRDEEVKREKEARERKIEERKKAARTNTRSTLRKKPKDNNQQNTATQDTIPKVVVSPADLAKQKEDQELKALQQKHDIEMKELDAEAERLQKKWESEIAELDREEQAISDKWDMSIQDLSNKEKILEDQIAKENEKAEAEPEEEIAKKKEDPDKMNKGQSGGLFKHRPAYSTGLLLLAKTYVERANWNRAEYFLRKLANNQNISKDVAREIPAVLAHSYIKQKQFDNAIPYLDQAIDLANKKTNKARYAYVVAQLYQMQGNSAYASEYFQRASDYSHNYEMEFNSKLSLLRNSWLSSNSSVDATVRSLEKLSKDGKNKDYIDQIYFTMAEVKLAAGDEVGAFEDFKKAAANSGSNSLQKTESLYRLASIYYEKEDYINAKLYYDSTALVMKTTDERRPEVDRLKKSLTDIARNIGIIKEQDSLLRLSELPEEELMVWAQNQVDAKNKTMEAEAEMQDKEKDEPTLTNRNLLNRVGGGGSNFFAYNPLTLQKGKLDFQRKWGQRKLEDNWRRASKQSSIIEETIEEPVAVKDQVEEDELLKEVLRDIPITDSQKESVKKRMSSAMFELAVLYRTKLQDYSKSAEVLEDLLSDYPTTSHEPDALYYLYLNYLELNNPTRAEIFLNRIVNKYPDSEYAAILNDPNYLAKKEDEKRALDNYYHATYEAFNSADYDKAEMMIEEAASTFGKDNTYSIKFDFLSAMIQGSKNGKSVYIKSLKDFIAKYPNTAEQTRAREIMRFLQGDDNAFDSRLYEEELDEFNIENDRLHYIILVINNADEKMINNTKITLSKYNSTFHKLDKLKITNIYLNPETKSQIVLIRRFADKTTAMDYLDGTTKNASDFVNTDELDYEIFAVTQKNYREIMKQRSINKYRIFFEREYLR